MHLAIIKDDLTQYVHTHPESHLENTDSMEHNTPDPVHDNSDGHHGFQNLFIKKALAHGTALKDILPEKQISFMVNFSKAGTYKMFAQFRPKGIELKEDESLVAEFYVKVLETGPDYPKTSEVMDHHTNDSDSSKKPLSRGVLVIISLGLIVLLGFGAYKFTNIK